ncbi:hypothetical protein QYE76_011828 [Lolium multiflorum]|nr:hypothetical protein QYE76_011828 [Lolium multiflorum]
MSSSSSSSTLAAALGVPPTQTLNRTNHLAWKALVLPAFRGARVMGLLIGTDSAPPETLEEEDADKKMIQVPNPAYDTWIARDQQVLRFLLNSLSPDILSHVLSAESSAEAWSMIDGMFKTAARSKTQHLRSQLNDTKKLSMSADDYFTKMKGFASELAAVGKPLDDDELVGYLLRGLDKDHYNSLITNINGKPDTTLDEFFGQLSSYDMRNGTVQTVEIVDAKTIEEVVVAVFAVIAEMILVQEETVMIALVDGLMIAARIPARDAVVLTVPQRRLWTPHVKSATSMDILQRTAGGAMVMMMTLMIEAPKDGEAAEENCTENRVENHPENSENRPLSHVAEEDETGAEHEEEHSTAPRDPEENLPDPEVDPSAGAPDMQGFGPRVTPTRPPVRPARSAPDVPAPNAPDEDTRQQPSGCSPRVVPPHSPTATCRDESGSSGSLMHGPPPGAQSADLEGSSTSSGSAGDSVDSSENISSTPSSPVR